MKRILKHMLFLCCMMMLLVGIADSAFAAGTKVKATAISSSEIELKWDSVAKASKYKVYRSNSLNGSYTKLSTVSKTKYKDTLVKGGKTYYYRIVPVNSSKKDMKKAQMSVKAKTAATTEVTKINVKSPTKVILYWEPSKNANGYEIYRSNSKDGEYELLEKVKGKAATSFTDSSIRASKTYYYRICPTLSNNGVAGKGSDSLPVLVKTVAKTKFTDITSTNSKAMKLTWKKVNNATNYEIYRSTKKDSGYKKIVTVGKGTTTFTDKSIKSSKKYFYKIVTVGKLNGKRITSGYSDVAAHQTLARVQISSAKYAEDDVITVKWKKVDGAANYKIYRATSAKGTYKKIATVKSNGKSTQSYKDKKVKPNKTYFYKVQAYSSEDGLIGAGKGDKSEYKKVTTSYAIMGKTSVTVAQMVKLYKSSGKKYPSVYKKKGAKNIQKFCEIVVDECEKEGVKGEVIFAQVCLETGYLSFGGQVKKEQCNFGGLGATDDGAAGATFPDVRTGIRAQVQHLKGYASKDSLNQKCVDPRFKYLTFRRGTTPFVQQLGDGNWATDPNYAPKLMALINKMKAY